MDFDVLVTSMLRVPNSITGESNVHATGRALDLIPLRVPGGPDITANKMNALAECLNRLYPRADKKPLCMWHNVNNSGWHVHIQVPATKDFKDLDGTIPKFDA